MKRGFTLSEVLITLGIVGVVAVLTVPSVMRNYRNRLYVSQLQKTYSQLSDAVQAIMRDENVDNFYESTAFLDGKVDATGKGTEGFARFMSEYFKVNKYDCARKTPYCVADSYSTLSGNAGGNLKNWYCVQTVNGATLCPGKSAADKRIDMYIDVNGSAAPNVGGRDLFLVSIKPDGTVSDYVNKWGITWYEGSGYPANSCSTGSGLSGAARGCLNAIIDAGWKMEY